MKNQYLKDYIIYGRNSQLKLEGFENIILADDKVRLLEEVLERMDYTALYRAYSEDGRPPKPSPKTMFKIMVYANSERIYSSREIEKACQRDVNFMWLLNAEPAPSHNTVNRFRNKYLPQAAEDLFYQLVKHLYEVGEIDFENLFVDGTKIEANANKYTFVWRKSTNKFQARLRDKVSAFLQKINKEYEYSFDEETPLVEVLEALNKRVHGVAFVHGKGKRKSEIQRRIEELAEYVAREEKYERYNATFNGRNSFSKTDPDATFMHMKDDHMRNAQLKPGYNVQLGVESEYITGADIFSERNDLYTLIPLLRRMESHTGHVYADVTADAGYESEENYTYFEQKDGQTCFIKSQNYERSKTRKFKNNMNLRENMPYDMQADEYTCQNGKKLRVVYTGTRKAKNGFESEVTYYECENCEGCLYKKSCTRAKGNRKMQLSKKFIGQRQKSLENITTEQGILLRINRSIQVEGAFGVLKEDYGFRRFLLRGKKKARVEVLLMAIAFDINKLHHKIQDNRCGSHLFEKNIA
jgi:transposase